MGFIGGSRWVFDSETNANTAHNNGQGTQTKAVHEQDENFYQAQDVRTALCSEFLLI